MKKTIVVFAAFAVVLTTALEEDHTIVRGAKPDSLEKQNILLESDGDFDIQNKVAKGRVSNLYPLNDTIRMLFHLWLVLSVRVLQTNPSLRQPPAAKGEVSRVSTLGLYHHLDAPYISSIWLTDANAFVAVHSYSTSR